METGEKTRVTDPMFDAQNPAFDRKGDYLYYKSARVFAPTYSDLPNDSTFVYKGSEVLLAVPLREDMDYVWAPESDEESWDDEKETDEDEAETEEDAEEDDASEDADSKPAEDDGVSGSWSGVVDVPDMGPLDMTLTLTLQPGGKVSATLSTAMFSGSGDGTYDADTGEHGSGER